MTFTDLESRDAGAVSPADLCIHTLVPFGPRAGSGVVRKDLLRFLAECRKRRLNHALSVLSLSPGFF